MDAQQIIKQAFENLARDIIGSANDEQPKQQIFQYVDALCGAGKTTSACAYIKYQVLSSESNFIYAVPTLDLADEIHQRLTTATEETFKHPYEEKFTCGLTDVHTIKSADNSSQTHYSETAFSKAKSAINSPSTNGRVVILSHITLLNLLKAHDSINCPEEWSLITDEPLQETLGFGEIFSDYIDRYRALFDTNNKLEIRAATRKKALLDSISNENCRDAIYHSPDLKKLAEKIVHPYISVAFEEPDESDPNYIRWVSRLLPAAFEGFKETIMMSANFEDLLLTKIWQYDGATFEKYKPITNNLRYLKHENGSYLQIHYLLENKSWRTTRVMPKGKRCSSLIEDIALPAIQAKTVDLGYTCDDVLIRTNTSVKFDSSTGIRLNGPPYGLNEWSEKDAAVDLMCKMPLPHVSHYLKREFNLTDGEIRNGYYHQETYQTIMRCSLRDPNCTRDRSIFVGDKPTAEYIQDRFEGSTIEYLPSGLQSRIDKLKNPPLTDRQRKAKQQVKKKLGRDLTPRENDALRGFTEEPRKKLMKFINKEEK